MRKKILVGIGLARISLMAVLFLLLNSRSFSQTNTPVQQVRGIVLDQVLGMPIEGATVTLPSINKSVITDSKGVFRFNKVPVGIHQLIVTSVGYKEVALDNINVNSGKELVLNISIENLVKIEDAVLIKTGTKRNKPLNEMSTVSARAFTVEETQKYAAAVNDPLRMAAGFPGVFAIDDGNNNIAIRGNSPTGLLWRMEGIDIPNPNHFSSTGSSGGGISILSAQLLSNSDFVTSAFAAEYGNALSGAFDLKLRRGNNEKREYTLQAGLLGLNAAMEGPFSKKYKGSYLINYRYSTLSLLDKLGVGVGEGVTNFQDLAYNFYFPTKRLGTFTWFGFNGLSSQDTKVDMDSTKWENKWDRYKSEFVSNTTTSGITHNILLGNKTSLRSAIGYSYNKISDDYKYVHDDFSMTDEYIDYYKTKKWTLTSTVNHKISPRQSIRAGAIVSHIGYDYFQKSKENDTAPMEVVIDSKDATQTVQAFGQWQFKPVNNVTINAGLHYLQMLYNNTSSVEPRISVKWQANPKNSLAFGFGGHSQLQALGVYFAQAEDASGKIINPNKHLDLTRARHYVLSYQHSFSKNLSLKTEVYYQQLYDVPVSTYDTSSFSVLNIQSEYVTDPLANNGKGKNYGVEISLERYLRNNFYGTFSTSLYQSKYTAADGVERDTKFNGNYLVNFVTGKEFLSANKLRAFGVNIKTIYAGGLRRTPVDEEKSRQAGYEILRENEAFSIQNPDYFRTDIRVSMTWNRKRLTSTLSLDIQNVTNRLNVHGQWYDSEYNKMVTSYQTGMIPILNYKVEF